MYFLKTLKIGIKSIESNSGYYSSSLITVDELLLLRKKIQDHYRKILLLNYPKIKDKYLRYDMSDYHTWSYLIQHSTLWPKKNRILPKESVIIFKKTFLFKSLQKIFGNIRISNEENIEEEEIYWRLVRPNEPMDVGPKHADSWFWKCEDKRNSIDTVRLKIWLSIFGEQDKSGFVFSPGSHKKDLQFTKEERDGQLKPKPSSDIDQLTFVQLQCPEGSGIIFHDSLVHGGEPGALKTRVSLECTLLINKKAYNSAMH